MFRVILDYEVWANDGFNPTRVNLTGITDLVLFGGATAGVEPNVNGSPYIFPMRNYTGKAYLAMMHGVGWAEASKYGVAGTWAQLWRKKCDAAGTNLILDLGGEWGAPAAAHKALIANQAKWEQYFNEVDQVCLANPDGVRFDGIEYDIEYLDTQTQAGRDQWHAFVTAHKAHLAKWPGKPGIMGCATPIWWLWSGNDLTTPYMNKATALLFDFLYVMAYNTENPQKLSFMAQLLANAAIGGVEPWDQRALKQYKASLGSGANVVMATSNEVLFQTPAGSLAVGAGATSSTTGGNRKEINAAFDSAQLDPISKSAFLILNGHWYSFETRQSMDAKCAYVQANGGGGVAMYGVWPGSDLNGASAINKAYEAFRASAIAAAGGVVKPPKTSKFVIDPPGGGPAGTSIAVGALSSEPVQSMTVVLDGGSSRTIVSQTPATTYTPAIGDHTLTGFVTFPDGTILPLNPLTFTITPSAVTYTQAQLDQAVADAVAKATAGLFTQAQMDANYNAGWNAAIDATPSTIPVALPYSGTATGNAPVAKPAKR